MMIKSKGYRNLCNIQMFHTLSPSSGAITINGIDCFLPIVSLRHLFGSETVAWSLKH